eukprot:21812-Eustigmatos_ZCMA.PRE.1
MSCLPAYRSAGTPKAPFVAPTLIAEATAVQGSDALLSSSSPPPPASSSSSSPPPPPPHPDVVTHLGIPPIPLLTSAGTMPDPMIISALATDVSRTLL